MTVGFSLRVTDNEEFHVDGRWEIAGP
jgi:hypothetical protein